MGRVTIGILAEKIDNLHTNITELKNNVNYIRTDVKENTSFRLQFKGVLAGITFISGLLGAGLMWLLSFLTQKIGK